MLPKIPYSTQKTKRQNIAFYGLNRTDNTTDGELSDSCGISSNRFPYLTQRKGRSMYADYMDATDVFEWDGHFIVVSGGFLFVDGEQIDSIKPGKKQFAVVGNKLIVAPDMLMVDLTDGTYEGLLKKVETADQENSAFFYDNYLIASTVPVLQTGPIMQYYYESGGFLTSNWWEGALFYTYGQSAEAVEACWDKVHQRWNYDMLEELEEKKSCWGRNASSSRTQWSDGKLEYGDIIIPRKVGLGFEAVHGSGERNIAPIEPPDKSLYNNEGAYMVLDSYFSAEDASWTSSAQGTCTFKGIGGIVFSADRPLVPFSEVFNVGDIVSISGSRFNNKQVEILDFEEDEYGEYTGIIVADGTFEEEECNYPIVIKSEFPDFDFICERGNRLWGVCNRDNTVACSAQGNPANFNYADTSVGGAWNLELGSEGDATAICSYGGATCVWKENRLIKVLGNLKTDFYTTEYQIKGVQKGSEKSLCNINEALYYKGVGGVYRYTGSIPSLLSEKLGRDIYTGAAGGTDGSHYYISMKKGDENYFFSYDLINGLWMCEDKIYASSFTSMDDTFFVSNGYVYKMNQDGEVFDWHLEFVPFTERGRSSNSTSAAFERKNYTKLLFRLDMATGSNIHISVKEDRGLWREVYTQSASKLTTLTVPLKLKRCDSLRVKISGKGEVTIMAMAREFNLGSDV